MDKTYPSTNNLPLPGVQPSASATSYPKAESAPKPEVCVSKDPFVHVYKTIPVNNSAGDSPVVRTPGYRFTSLDPYARPEGITPSPVTPEVAAKG